MLAMCLILSCYSALLKPTEARMHDDKFHNLLHMGAKHSSNMTADQHYRLLFAALPVEDLGWDSPSSLGKDKADAYRGLNFSVVLVHAPPLVNIEDPQAVGGDPGNLEQTRTVSNGRLSGLVIDLLSHIQDSLGCSFTYVYPCKRVSGSKAQTCESADYTSVSSALEMLDTARVDVHKYGLEDYAGLEEEQKADDKLYLGGGPALCPEFLCFVASNVKVTEERMKAYFMTQPFLYKGFVLVVNSGAPLADYFSWASPFMEFVWVLTLGEIVIATVAFCICEGYGIGNALSEYKHNPLLLVIQAFQWSLLLFLGAASRQPATHAGRTLVLANLFFVMIWISVYTGNLNQFLLSVPREQKVNRIADFSPVARTSLYSKKHNMCIPREQAGSVEAFLENFEADFTDGYKVPRVNGSDLFDCLAKVYQGEATATMYDEPVVLDTLKSSFYDGGMHILV